MKHKTITFLALGLLLSLMSAVSFAQHIAVTPEPVNADWWKQRHAANVEQMSKGDIDVLMIGDSITHGWEGHGKAMWDLYYGNRKPINIGFSGDRTEHVLWRLDNLPLDKISPKLAVIMIGTNNVGHGSTNPKEAADGIKAIVNRLQKEFPEMKILVLNVFPRDNKADGDLRKKVDEINSYLPKLLKNEKNVTLLDINANFLEKDGTLPPEIMPDFLHPEGKGYALWARAVEPTISKLLNEKNPATEPAERLGEQWWKDRHEKNVAQMNEGKVELLMIGDSITHGWDNENELWDKTFGEYKPINLGFSGDQTQHVLWRLENLPLSKIKPKAAEIMIGTNNIHNPNNTPYQIALGIKAIVEKLQKQYPNIKVVVLKVFPREENVNDWARVRVNEINAFLPDLLKGMKNVELVDINDKLLTSEGVLSKDIMPDLLHPNHAGYEIWAAEISPVTDKVMKNNTPKAGSTRRNMRNVR
ncbi:MAG: GDSL-type esterase/lipase family protein [Thermoguttaceae bacterium]